MVARTSKLAYEELVASGKDKTQNCRILQQLLIHHKTGLTRRQLARATGIELGAVCGRVNALVKDGLAAERGEQENPRTKLKAKLVWPVIQAEMPL